MKFTHFLLPVFRPAPVVCLAAVLAAVLAACLAGPARGQAKTPAGTLIRNQAALEFYTLEGDRLTATSNEVVMLVTEVYAVEVLPDGGSGAAPWPESPGQEYRAVAGARVVLPYLLQNLGNALDSATLEPVFDHLNSAFLPLLPDGTTGFRVYNDLAGNGVVDPGDILAAAWQDLNQDGVLQVNEITGPGLGRDYRPDEFANLLIVFDLPAGVSAGQRLHLGVNAASVNDPSAIDDQGNISRVEVVENAAVIAVSKAADRAAAGAGDTITWTVVAVNRGDRAAEAVKAYDIDGVAGNYRGVLIFDVLPVNPGGTVFPLDPLQPPSGATDQPGATGTVIYSDQPDPDPAVQDPGGWAWFTAPPAEPTVVGYILSDGATHFDLDPGNSVTLEFSVAVPADPAPQVLVNRALARYNDIPAGERQVVSNEVRVTIGVAAAGGVDFYDLDGDTGGETRPQHPLVEMPDGIADRQTISAVPSGAEVYFVNRVRNTGTVEDTFNISVAGGLPAGWQLSFLALDGVSPLPDTGLDGFPDTGPLAPGAFRDVRVRLRAPHTGDPAGAVITLRAESVRFGAAVGDETVNRVLEVEPPGMLLVNNVGGAEEPAEITRVTSAGTFVDFPLLVKNTADPVYGAPDTYTLSFDLVTGNQVPMTGWSVLIYRDLNQDGQLDPAELSPLAATGLVRPFSAPDDYEWLIARVFIPADAPYDSDPAAPGVQDYRVEFRADSTNLPGVLFDTQVNRIRLEPKDLFELRPDRTGTIEPGSVTWYGHVLQNYAERPNRFYLDLVPGNPAWSHLLYDMAEPPAQLPSDGGRYYIDLDEAGAAADRAEFRLRILAPAGTPANTVDVTSITASARDHGIAAVSTVVDVTRVVAGDLTLDKTVAPPGPAAPGDTLTYTTTFFNKSAGPLADVVIYDQVPANSVFVSGSQSSTLDPAVAYEVSADGGLTWVPPGAPGPAPAVTNLRAILSDPLPPGAEHRLEFSVLVK